MRVLDPGHTYALDKFEDKEHGIGLRFIKKEEIDGELTTIHDGTTNEEVIRALLHRLKFLNDKVPSDYNRMALAHLEGALLALEERTKDRKDREIEGTNKQ